MTSTAAAPAALQRRLGLPGVVLFGLAYMAPLIVLGTFGIVATTTEGTVPSAYLLALVAMLFTAASYGKMAATHPVAGSAYTYVRKAVDARAGFLVGWAVLLDYFFLPMVIWLIGGAYLSAEFPSGAHLALVDHFYPADDHPQRPRHQDRRKGELRADGVPDPGDRLLRRSFDQAGAARRRVRWPARSRSSTPAPRWARSPAAPRSRLTPSSASTPSRR